MLIKSKTNTILVSKKKTIISVFMVLIKNVFFATILLSFELKKY